MTFTVCELENGPVEIANFPHENSMVDLSIVLCRFTRGSNPLDPIKPP